MFVEDQASPGRQQKKHQLVEPEYGPTRKDRRRDTHSHPGQPQYRPQVGQGLPGFIGDYFRDFRPGLIERLFRYSRPNTRTPAGTYYLPILESSKNLQ